MVQINDDNYEDLTFDSTTAILEALARGETPKPGPQIDRRASCPEGGPTALKEMVDREPRLPGNGDERLIPILAVFVIIGAMVLLASCSDRVRADRLVVAVGVLVYLSRREADGEGR